MKWVLLRPVARAQDTRTGAQREGGKKKPKFPHPPRERARAIARTFSKGLAKTLSAVPIQEMLDACRSKGFDDLTQHDLTLRPYPYGSNSLDLAVCVGVLNFFSDLSAVFGETARLLRKGGLFVFVVGDRTENEAPEILVGTEHTQSGAPVTMYRHSARQIKGWLDENGFAPLRSLAFSVPVDREMTQSLRASAYLVRRSGKTCR